MKKLILTIMLVFPFFAYGQDSQTETYEVYQEECLDYRGFERRVIGGVLHFKNLCGEKITANVCVEFSDGTSELRTNRRRIPKYGSWRLTVHTRTPTNIHWASAPYDPVVPGSCGGEEQ